MSSVVTVFDPANPATNAAQFTVPQSSANGALVFFNESNISIFLTFADGSNMYLPAWYHRHKCGASGSVNVSWNVHQVLSSLAPPISNIIVESFAAGEKFPADGPLVRQTNTGNVVSTVGGTANAVQNDGSSPGTSVGEATASDDTASSWTLNNIGNQTLGTALHHGSLQIVGPTSVNGNNVLVDTTGTVTIPNKINANLITSIVPSNASGNDLGFHVQDTFHVIDTVNNIKIFKVGSEGPTVLVGKFQFPFGQALSGISFFGPYTSVTTPTSFNHNLGTVPDIVLTQVSGGVTTVRTIMVNYQTFTSTTFDADCNLAGFVFYGIALKF